MTGEAILATRNVTIVESPVPVSSEADPVRPEDLLPFAGDMSGTVTLAIAPSKAVTIGRSDYVRIQLLFGSWVESGGEDDDLSELYRSRLFPASAPAE